MEYMKGFTFAPFCAKGILGKKESYESLKAMRDETGANMVIFAPVGWQDTAQSEQIDFRSDKTCGDDELCDIVSYARELGLMVGLKPTVNCKNGTWRAHVNFFDEDVPCEPKWCNWFASYTEFQLHYAAIAEKMDCDIFIAGCEMVMTERRESEWRKLIGDIRTVYHGPVSYNTDKYQEHNVKWWDCVDIISSSGYYPVDDWKNQMNRIEQVVKKFDKPFFFAELGCMSVEGSKYVPNDWYMDGAIDEKGQAEWFQAMFQELEQNSWVQGLAIWSWSDVLYSQEDKYQKGYEIYGKEALPVVKEHFTRM
ncbi:MAG: 1,4-beta-xylanase [Clostridium sp.]|nr:1,4-beta-xylanase [Clostridium sp.]